MEIKLPHMPFKFDTPDGPMEITVRSGRAPGRVEGGEVYSAAAAFIDHGPRALERIQISTDKKTHAEVMRVLVTGFVVDLDTYDKQSQDFRVLDALCHAQGVTELET
jgi:hypothetical protein